MAPAAPPAVIDDRLVLELVAQQPDVATPTGLTVDEKGRVWVIENHTHQRETGYKGPTSDRIRILADLDARGRSRTVTTFADGFKDTMSLAFSPAGELYSGDTIGDLFTPPKGRHARRAEVAGAAGDERHLPAQRAVRIRLRRHRADGVRHGRESGRRLQTDRRPTGRRSPAAARAATCSPAGPTAPD
ncbi:MAG: hypothetical protein U0736_06705 [Gemmataceae bacterium]